MTDIPNIEEIRSRFPTLHQQVNGKPLIYLDNAATSQTVDSVIESVKNFYEKDHANIHRGIHTLADRSTKKYEAARKKVHQLINSKEVEEIVFTKGTSESINLVAHSFGKKFLKEGDEIILSYLEHHSNIVPWQLIAEQTGAKIKVIPINEKGELIFEEYQKLLNERTKIVSVNNISNALGTINPIKEIIQEAQKFGAKTLIDAAQTVPHQAIDVQDLACDFLVFSTHKMYGPTGVGVLYGKREILEAIPPYQGGGEMIKDVSFEKTTYNDIPYKFEAGTPNIGDVIALSEAIDFINEIGYETIKKQENTLLQLANEKLQEIEGIKFYGTASKKASVISFLVDGMHSYDVGQLLDARGIAVRTGHHCTQPLMDFLKIEGTIRASFAVYNTVEEIEHFADHLNQIVTKYR